MFDKIKWVWGIFLIGTITAEQELDDHKTHCSAGDARIVQREWGDFWRAANSDLRIALAKEAVFHVVDKHPEAMHLFQKIDDPDSGIFEAHCLRIFNYFDFLINLLHDKEAFRRESVRLGHEHAAIPGMLGKYFTTFTEHAVNVLNQYDYRVHSIAWEHCMNDLLEGVFEAIPN